jgi:putative ABC transport system substrate-binding protein
MQRRPLLGGAALLSLRPGLSSAQAVVRPVRLGWLTAQNAASLAPYIEAVRRSLADLGYVEGRNLTLEFRYADGALSQVPALAADLERIPVDLIMAQGAAVPLVRDLALKLPVIYVFSGDPVSAGLAQTLSQPRGNMTGLTFMAAELNAKRLEMLREVIPKLRDVAVVANPEHPGAQWELADSQAAARRLGLRLKFYPTPSRDALTAALATIATTPVEAISLFADGFAIENRQRIIDFAMQRRIPVISGWPLFARSGALFTYGPRLIDSYRRLAYFVDRVLKGTRPADLPIERPATFELVLNRQTAQSLGISLPQALLLRADEVIG